MPQGAEIFIAREGEPFTDTGIVTPDTITDLDPGNYTIKLTKSGYNDAEMVVTVTQGQTTYVGMTLIITRVIEAGMPWWFVLSLTAGTIYGMMKSKIGDTNNISAEEKAISTLPTPFRRK